MSNDQHIVRGATVPGTNDGSFAPQHKREGDPGMLVAGRPVDEFFSELHRRSGVWSDQIDEALNSAGVTGSTVTPDQERLVHISLAAAAASQDALRRVMESHKAMMEARQALVKHRCEAVAAMIQARHPQVDKGDLVDQDGSGEWHIEAWDGEGARLDLGFDDPGSDHSDLALNLATMSAGLGDAKDADFEQVVDGRADIQRTWEGRPTRITLSLAKVGIPR